MKDVPLIPEDADLAPRLAWAAKIQYAKNPSSSFQN